MKRIRIQKKRKFVPYRWRVWIDMGECLIPSYPLNHKKPKLKFPEFATLKFFGRKRKCWTGWDFDRQRFICEGSKARYVRGPSRKSTFMRKRWERLHGFD